METSTTATIAIPPVAADASVAELVEALAAAQTELEPPRKTKSARVEMKGGGSYTYAYADLADVIASTLPVLARHGIAVVQDVTTEPGAVHVTTTLRRGEGALRFGPLSLPVNAGTPQAIGSAITYARRYALTAALGVAAETDDDGTTAAQAPPRATERTMRQLHAIAATKGVTHEQMRDWAGRHLGIESLAELTPAGAAEMIASLRDLPDAEIAENDAAGTVEPGAPPSSRERPRAARRAGPGSGGADTLPGAGETGAPTAQGSDGAP